MRRDPKNQMAPKARKATPGAKTFGQLLKEHRERKELTGRELADQAGILFPSLYKLERDATKPTWETVQKLAIALGISTEELRSL